jgi:hypothetical protein
MPSIGPVFPGPSSGLLVSPVVGTYGLTVGDAAGVTRVQLGQIGTAFGQNYGLKVVSADGATVIIDGTSDIFKIAASGTLAVTIGSVSSNETTVTLTGLGALPVTPAFLGYGAQTATTTAQQGLGGYILRGFKYASTSSGGAVTAVFVAPDVFIRFRDALDGSGNCVVGLGGDSASAVSQNAVGRYYVLTQAAM